MFKFDLLNIFEGLVRNYTKFNLNKNDKKDKIIKTEIKYIQSVGEVLGYSSIVEGIKKDSNNRNSSIEVFWREYNDRFSMPGELILHFSSEQDITKDIFAIQSILTNLNNKDKASYIQIIEVSSEARIDYLNSLIEKSKFEEDKDILIVYKIPKILQEKTDLYAYLFNGNKLIRKRKAISYTDIFNSIKVKFDD